ncbi:MAG: helix-turn-helix domain-containing protein [Pseudobdellovibrionaceae bacterium]
MNKASSLQELELLLGEDIKRLRLQKNLDRQTLCDRAGISMNALRHLETGSGATVKTLLLVVRALERLDWLSRLAPQVSINPLHTIRDKTLRERASRRPRNHGKNKKS